jgi:hypothetical protein
MFLISASIIEIAKIDALLYVRFEDISEIMVDTML